MGSIKGESLYDAEKGASDELLTRVRLMSPCEPLSLAKYCLDREKCVKPWLQCQVYKKKHPKILKVWGEYGLLHLRQFLASMVCVMT